MLVSAPVGALLEDKSIELIKWSMLYEGYHEVDESAENKDAIAFAKTYIQKFMI